MSHEIANFIEDRQMLAVSSSSALESGRPKLWMIQWFIQAHIVCTDRASFDPVCLCAALLAIWLSAFSPVQCLRDSSSYLAVTPQSNHLNTEARSGGTQGCTAIYFTPESLQSTSIISLPFKKVLSLLIHPKWTMKQSRGELTPLSLETNWPVY